MDKRAKKQKKTGRNDLILQDLIPVTTASQKCHMNRGSDSQRLRRYGYLKCSLTWKLVIIYLFKGLYISVDSTA
jgi:hypothetical protein